MNTAPAAPAFDCEPDTIHPYILQALQAARRGDLDALEWLEMDCPAWAMIEPNAAQLAFREIRRPARHAKQKPHRKPQDARNGINPTKHTQPIHPAQPYTA